MGGSEYEYVIRLILRLPSFAWLSLPRWRTSASRLSREASGARRPIHCPPAEHLVYIRGRFSWTLRLRFLRASSLFIPRAPIASFTNPFPFLLQDPALHHVPCANPRLVGLTLRQRQVARGAPRAMIGPAARRHLQDAIATSLITMVYPKEEAGTQTSLNKASIRSGGASMMISRPVAVLTNLLRRHHSRRSLRS